jgi:DNA-binding XRE family transcriptional regulator
MKMHPDHWPRVIKALERTHSLREIAREIDVSPGTLCDIKRGRTKRPSLNVAIALTWLMAKSLDL